ncbi:MAG TPA: RNA polymerase subunit sigma-70 [Polyangiaceae bacterium]|nr:RNA polymerase subunit sigma-70 [Polyangiaceae bacterium]
MSRQPAPSKRFPEELAVHRPALLRHCYRMLGAFADAEDLVQEVLLRAWRSRETYAGEAPLEHWLFRIATNACLNELASRKRRGLPQLDRAAGQPTDPLETLDATEWLTPAPDSALFDGPARALETRESVALAFLALLQRLPARQRAVLLLKDVVGWSADEIAAALELSLGSVNSALHRARETVATRSLPLADDPPPAVLRDYVRTWEMRDVDGLVSLLKEDVVFAMPPIALWVHGAGALARFLETPRLTASWAKGFRLVETRANGQTALVFYRPLDGAYRPTDVQLVRFVDGRLAEATTFFGAAYLRGFDVPDRIELS